MQVVRHSLWLSLALGLSSTVQAQSSHLSVRFAGHGGGHHSSGGMVSNSNPGVHFGGYAVSGGYGGFGGYGYGGYGYGGFGPYVYTPPLFLVTPGFPALLPIVAPQPFPVGAGMGGGLMLPNPPRQLLNPNPVPPRRRTNPSRAKEQLDIGDRSFRANNIKRAEEKYNIAVKADPTSPTPHVHLAQVSLARGDYAAAADHLRDAITVADPAGWLLTTPDIQTIFAEPADFAKQLARLESHLQANPNDRDAWFVLGAEYYLSGRSKQASDIFQRLSDRKPDEALAAFMDASKTKLPAAAN